MSQRFDQMCKHPLITGTEYRLVVRHNLPEELSHSMVRGLVQFLEVLASEGITLSPPSLIDFAWHEALIDTSAYQKFCSEFFTGFLHHYPPHGPEDNRPETFELTNKTVELGRAMFGDDLESVVWRRSKRVQVLSRSAV